MQTQTRLALASGTALIVSGALIATPVLRAQDTATSHPGATVNTIQLPPETAELRPSQLTGYTLATRKCLICHSADYVNFQAPGMDQVQWTAEVTKMQRAYGAPLNDDEVRSIGAYLAVAYGPEKSTDASIVAASVASTPNTVAVLAPGAPFQHFSTAGW